MVLDPHQFVWDQIFVSLHRGRIICDLAGFLVSKAIEFAIVAPVDHNCSALPIRSFKQWLLKWWILAILHGRWSDPSSSWDKIMWIFRTDFYPPDNAIAFFISNWSAVKWLSKVITLLRFLRLVIGLKIPRQFFNQWEAKPKPIAPRTLEFSRALSKL